MKTASEFWARVRPASRGCLEWQGSITPRGYGSLCFDGKTALAHRLAWGLTYGKPPAGVCVLHRCDNRKCCNPQHLFLGSRADNNADMVAKGRHKGAPGENHPNTSLTDQDVLNIAADTREYKVIAEAYGVSASAVGKIKMGRTWKHLVRPRTSCLVARYGETHSRSKLTTQQAKEIFASTDVQHKLAARYGVTQMVISKIKRKVSWRRIHD